MFGQDLNLRSLDSELRLEPVRPREQANSGIQALVFVLKLASANVCQSFGWSAVSASCLLAAWLFGGSGGGWVAECSVHRIAARKFTSPTPSQTEAGCRRGDSTLHTVHENTHKHTTSLWIVNYTLTEHHHMSTESVRGLLGGLVDAWHLCGSRGEGEGIMCGFQ